MVLHTDDLSTTEYISRVRKAVHGLGMYYHVITFGCQQNEADSERIRGMAENMGYLPSPTYEGCDLIIVNTCAIREHAEMKALSFLGAFKAEKKKNPDLIVGVVGCMAAEPHVADKLKRDFHYVSFTAEPNMLHRIPELIYTLQTQRKRSFIFGEDRGDIVEGMPTVRRDRHKAWVSIMYGCNNFCSYCIVPYVRGRERSRESQAVLEECRELISAGVKEITLLGQNVNSYHSDIDFPELLSRIAALSGDFLIRFMTSHPKDTSDKLIEVMGSHKDKIAPYFHLPLQSGSNRILSRMNRTYTRERFLSIVEKLRASVPGISLSTDVIVGFPGESEEDFEDTLEVLRTARFDMVYGFIYSPREGTRAATFEDKVPDSVKSERLTRLLKMQDEISVSANAPYLGRVLRVLVDSFEVRDGVKVYTGRADTGKPVHFTGDAQLYEYVNVRIEKTGAFDLIGSTV